MTPVQGARIPSLNTAKTKRAEGDKTLDSPGTLARNYVQAHGSEVALRMAAKLEDKNSPSSRDRSIASSLRAYAGQNRPSTQRGAGGKSAAPAPATPAGVRSAYESLTNGKNRQWVKLSDLRPRLGGTREEQDAAIRQMLRAEQAVTAPHSGQARHHSDQIAASWQGNHLIALEPPE